MNQSVLKALDILNLFSISSLELSLSDISKRLDMPKPTAYRLLSSLESRGYVFKQKLSDYDIRYRLGLKLLELGNLVSEQMELRKVAYPHMKGLCDQINEVVHLVVVDQDEAVYIEKVEGNQALRLYTHIGKRSPLHIGSGPKLLLAHMNDVALENYLNATDFSSITHHSLTNKYDLKEEIETIKTQGYAISKGEQDLETIGISYPVRDHKGQVIAALAVSGPAIRFFGERGQLIKEKTEETAAYISRDLGYQVK